MKKTILLAALLTLANWASAQESLSREEALKYALATHMNLAALKSAPVKVDADLKYAVGAKEGEYGVLLIPECKLTANRMAKAGDKVVPVAQLWTHRLAPKNGDTVVAKDSLNLVSVTGPDGEVSVPLFILGVRSKADGLELLIYGKDKEPLVTVPMKSIDTKQEAPIELTASKEGDEAGRITLKFRGKYEASFLVTDPDA